MEMTDTTVETVETEVTDAVETGAEVAEDDGFMSGYDDGYTPEDSSDEATADVETAESADNDETPEEDTASEETESESINETIPYSYNHKTTDLPLKAVKDIATALGMSEQDVVMTLQKGSNYDTLQGRQTPYENAINRINRYADVNGMSREEAIAKAIDALDILDASKYLDEIKRQYPTAPQQMIQDMALMKVRQDANLPTPTETKEKEAADKQEAEREEMWTSFFKAHPDVKADTLSPRMLQALENYENPELVYMSEQNALLQKKLNELQEKSSRKARSTGTAKSNVGQAGYDAFLDGYSG